MSVERNTIEISSPEALPEKPVVSVLMLTYNHERFIAQAIEGVISQRCEFPFELIIGEDCSKDRTREIALEYQRRYPHIIRVLISEANVGAPINFVRCTKAARGKYLAICEGDDYWTDPLKLAKQAQVLDEHPETVLVFHDVVEVDSEGRVSHESAIGKPTRSTPKDVLGPRDIFRGARIPTLSIMYRNIDVLSSPHWDTLKFGDIYLRGRLSAYGNARRVPGNMGAYRQHPGGVWSGGSEAFRYREMLKSSIATAKDIDRRLAIHLSWVLAVRVGGALIAYTYERPGSKEHHMLVLEGYRLALRTAFSSGVSVRALGIAAGAVAIPFVRFAGHVIEKKTPIRLDWAIRRFYGK